MGYPIWYILLVGVGGIVCSLSVGVLIGCTTENNADTFMLCFYAVMIGWITACLLKFTPKGKSKYRSNKSALAKFSVLTVFLIFPLVACSLWTYVGYDYPLTLRAKTDNGVFTVYGVKPGLTRQQVIDVWGKPKRPDSNYLSYTQDQRFARLKNNVVIEVGGDRLEQDGIPLLGFGASISQIEQVLGPGSESQSGGRANRLYPDLRLDVIGSDPFLPFRTEYRLRN